MTQAARVHDTSATMQQQSFTTKMSVGEILRRSRAHYKLSLQDIERELHIKPPQINAMESDRFDHLPGRVYAIGFIRSYSEFLGLDGDKMIRLYKNQIRGRTVDTTLKYPACPSESKTPSIWLVALTLIVLLAIAVFWSAASPQNTYAPSVIPDVPEHLKPTNDSASFLQTNAEIQETSPAQQRLNAETPTEDGLDAPDLTPSAPQQSQGIILKVTSESWVEIKSTDGQILVSKILNPGEQYFIPKRDGLSLNLDNAAAIRLEIEGQDIGNLGTSGEALRDFSLDFDYLKARTTQTSEETP